MLLHIFHNALSFSKRFNNDARKTFRHINDRFFVWFEFDAIFFFDDDLWLRYLQFVSLAPHGFKQNSDMQFAPSVYKIVIAKRKIYAEPHIYLELALQAFANLACSYQLSFSSSKWRIVYQKTE